MWEWSANRHSSDTGYFNPTLSAKHTLAMMFAITVNAVIANASSPNQSNLSGEAMSSLGVVGAQYANVANGRVDVTS